MLNKLFDFINTSPTAYHAVENIKYSLTTLGFSELYEGEEWELTPGGKYFVIKNGTSVIAFKYNPNANGYMICASHSDSPAFRLKTNPYQRVGAYNSLLVEKYGGMLHYSWLDRPLSLAGRVMLNTEGGLTSRIINIDRDILSIPSVAIHMNRNVNDALSLNPKKDMIPLFSINGESDLTALIASYASAQPEDIVSCDLFLYNRDKARVFGEFDEFILSPRYDNLACVFASLVAFMGAENSASVPVLAVFDNEEVGSETKQGAASGFLSSVLRRVSGGEDKLDMMLSQSFMVSADNAHAKHPNSPELADPNNAPTLGGGVVIKYNANQKYTTDALSDAVFRKICDGIKVQTYCNRADMPGGSTLGSISNTRVSVPTIDIGLPQLAMHSANETAAVSDLYDMVGALDKFYSASLTVKGRFIKLDK